MNHKLISLSRTDSYFIREEYFVLWLSFTILKITIYSPFYLLTVTALIWQWWVNTALRPNSDIIITNVLIAFEQLIIITCLVGSQICSCPLGHQSQAELALELCKSLFGTPFPTVTNKHFDLTINNKSLVRV